MGRRPDLARALCAGLRAPSGRIPAGSLAGRPGGGWLPPGAPATEADQRLGRFLTTLTVPGDPAPVEIAPHDVRYDPDCGLWFCDIEIDTGAAYWPFVRLALARYQHCPTQGAHVSQVGLTDVMPLAADRSFVVRAAEGRARGVPVFGPGYDASGGSREVQPRSEIDRLTGQVTEVTPVSPSSVVEVWLERLEPAPGPDFGWVRIGDGVPNAAAPACKPFAPPVDRLALGCQLFAGRRFAEALNAGIGVDQLALRRKLWNVRIELPEADRARLRLVIAEYEECAIDGPAPRHSMTSTGIGRRLVVVEHVPLS